MGCVDGLGRLLLVVLNIVFLLAGLALCTLGLILRYGKVLYEPFLKFGIDELEQFLKNTGLSVLNVDNLNLGEVMTSFAVGLIIGGLVLAIFAFVGCCGACCKVGCMLWLYVVALVVILVGEAVALGLLYGKPELVTDGLKDSLSDYKGVTSSEVYSVAWNVVMIQFHCCGVESYQDFAIARSWNRTAIPGVTLVTPVACCKTLPTGSSKQEFDCATRYDSAVNNGEIGCYHELWSKSLANTAMVVPILIILGLIQIFFIFFAIAVARSTED